MGSRCTPLGHSAVKQKFVAVLGAETVILFYYSLYYILSFVEVVIAICSIVYGWLSYIPPLSILIVCTMSFPVCEWYN